MRLNKSTRLSVFSSVRIDPPATIQAPTHGIEITINTADKTSPLTIWSSVKIENDDTAPTATIQDFGFTH